MATVVGTDKADWLAGTGGADYIKGFGGNDTLKGGGGADTLDGGAGIDTAIYADSTAGVSVSLLSGSGFGGFAQGDRLMSIENVWGSAYDDVLTGDNGTNELVGLDGSDFLFGNGGGDMLDGGYGDDWLEGGAGADVLNGGAGIDIAKYYDSPAAVIVSLRDNAAWGGDATGDTFIGVESLHGSSYDDVLVGDDNPNTLAGISGNDVLQGYGGPDVLFAGFGNDRLEGMDDNDILYGDYGQDTLIGGKGTDSLYGGPGADAFVWTATSETDTRPQTADVIWDFSFAEGDRIDLSLIDANVYAAGNQAFTFIGTAAFSGRPGEINYYHDNGDTIIQMQTGTSADVEGVIRIWGIVTPEASWFVL
jgi:Ca2+-binding RTX toxin-like protein